MDSLTTLMPKTTALSFDGFWKDMLEMFTGDLETHSPHRRRRLASEFGAANDPQFSSLPEDAGRILIQFEKAYLEWCHRFSPDVTLRRRVLDGGDIAVVKHGIDIEVTFNEDPIQIQKRVIWLA